MQHELNTINFVITLQNMYFVKEMQHNKTEHPPLIKKILHI